MRTQETRTPEVVIVIGAARSGTKFLRQLLAASDSVGATAYDIGYIWRYGNQSLPDDCLPRSACTPKIRDYIGRTVIKLASRAQPSPKIVVEKTVANGLRIPFVDAVFPDAKFLHLIRDGRDVVESAYRQWQKPTDWRYTLGKARQFPLGNPGYALWYLKNIGKRIARRRGATVWGPRYPGIDRDVESRHLVEVCARQWVACVDRAVEDLAALDRERQLTVAYEDLVADPSAVTRICEFVGIGDPRAVIDCYTSRVDRSTGGGWRDRLGNDLQAKMLAEIEPTLRKHGYQ